MTLAQELANALGVPLEEAELEIEDAEAAGILPQEKREICESN